jgi:hypothetical protein
MDFFQRTADGLVITLHVQPRAARTEVVGRHGDALKVRLQAPPVEGAANRACQAFIARQLGVSRSDVAIVAGESGRLKRLKVRAAREALPAIEARLMALAAGT